MRDIEIVTLFLYWLVSGFARIAHEDFLEDRIKKENFKFYGDYYAEIISYSIELIILTPLWILFKFFKMIYNGIEHLFESTKINEVETKSNKERL